MINKILKLNSRIKWSKKYSINKSLFNSRFLLFTFFYFWLFSLNISYVKSDIVLFIDLLNYSNPSGSLYTGQCCDTYLYEQNCSLIPNKCDVTIKICIDSSENEANISDPNSCLYGSYMLYGIRDLNTFDFRLNPQAERQFIFTLRWEYNYLPRYLLKFFALDDSSERRSILKTVREKLIDFYVVDFNADQAITPSNGLSNELNWIPYTSVLGRYSNANFQTYLSLRVAIKCRTNYFTPICAVRCVQQDSCEGGHYRCNELTGEKICLPGFIDPSTDCHQRNTSVSLCAKSDAEFCSNNGYCYNSTIKTPNFTLPTCCCNKGFGNAICSDILSCEVNPCLNGGACLINATTKLGFCNCRLGFKGKYCETKIVCPQNFYGDDCSVYCVAIDNCEIHQDCDYYGRLKCKDGWGSFPECKTRLINPSIDPECPSFSYGLSSPCQNGGSCWKGGCCCPPSYTGPRCETYIDQCLSSPCLNGASCLTNLNGFTCICPNGYTGIFCQTMIDPCRNSSLQCSGAGICIPNQNLTGFTCSCFDGYTGKFCEKQIDYCLSNPCLNNSTCVSLFKSYYCSCGPGFTGINCERQINFCQTNPCINGQCYNLVNDYVCHCNLGWTNSKTCNDDVNECSLVPSPCLNNSTCINLPGTFKCNCLPSFTGTYCQERIDYCVNSSCVSSQTILCQSNYQLNTYSCLCKPGFTGRNCELPIDYCASSPCIINQFDRCVNYQSQYNCICKPGYSGVNCEIDENECLSSPCANKGICIDQVNGYKCICPPGFSGEKCMMNTNPCQINQTSNLTVCGPYGTCYPQYLINGTSTYFCQCITGYEGANCNRTISLCKNYFPCLNGATCIDISPTNFTCICPVSYTGVYCERLVNPCFQGYNLCNGGTCINSPSGSNNFTCICPNGFTGQFCQSLINPCDSNKCVSSQGICQPLTLSNGTRSYQCLCLAGYTGEYCEISIDQCISKPCKNNATCLSMIGYYTCVCLANYYGNNCENFYQCSSQPCDQSGTLQCVDLLPQNNSLINYKCVCRSGFTGSRCEVNINECQSSPCRNNGTCVDLINSFVCKCTQNYVGLFCETPYDFCQINQCGPGSTCVTVNNSFKCICPANATGIFCTEPLDACVSLPCKNGGFCTNLGNDYRCICQSGYTGKNCSDVIDQCTQQVLNGGINYCKNNSTCVNLLNGFFCNCLPGFTGQYCQTPIDYCQSQSALPCLNGGTCVNIQNGYRCICADGYTGSRCDSNIDLCNSTICKNNGLCRTSINGIVYCTCPVGFTGYYCEKEINFCDSSPCLNSATCLSFPGSYICYCPFNFIGTKCETKRNFCQSSPCRNNGTCIDQFAGFTCLCLTGFSGEICQIQSLACSSFPCLFGTCLDSPNGGYVCNCRTGYTGPQCTERIDVCKTGLNGQPPCFNNGTCISTFSTNISNSFVCICPNGYTGNRCETIQSACESSPCIRGNCTNLLNNLYKCQCPKGFTGTNCESDINECELSPIPICFNNGTCLNTLGGFVCRCLNGFTGVYCELAIDNCFSNPCLNNGLCVNDVGSSFKCICLTGYTGSRCENVINYCSSSPCQNQGICVNPDNRPNYFTCICRPGFTGILCEQLIDPCLSKPCLNNAVCINRSTLNNTNTFVCACALGYTGQLCDTKIDPCRSQNRCLNGGTCLVIGTLDFKCICPSGYTGINCEVINSCLSYPCLNGGTCNLLFPIGYQCLCPSNFTGINCNQQVSACDPNPCLNSGTCIDRNGVFTCICPPDYTGSKCETYSTCIPSCLNGRCTRDPITNSNKCVCFAGYTGIACETDIKECNSNPCKNNGICSEPFLNMYLCYCAPGFTGINCDQIIRVCDSNPCLNNGTCSQTLPNLYTCQCASGFTGINCETQINQCNSNPCRNGATCVNGLNLYRCNCLPGTQGVNCEIDINECSSNPCQNNGTCSTPFINMYQCRCLIGYTGTNCESLVDLCISKPCKNNGVCFQYQANAYKCVCPLGYSGDFCQDFVDPCTYQKCSRNFTNLNFNVYGLSDSINFQSYQDCILNTWNYLNPTIKFFLNNTNLNLNSINPGLEFTDNSIFANRISSIFYSLTALNVPPSSSVNIPTASDYNRFCPSIVQNNVTLYDQYWDVSVCTRISDPTAFDSIRLALLKVWQQKYPEISSFLNVDIFRNLIKYYTSGNQQITRIFYLVYANQLKRIIEKGKITDQTKIPSNDELNNALQERGYQSCQAQILPITFSITICGPLKKYNLNRILSYIKSSWQLDPVKGGLGPNTQITIAYQGSAEFISDNSVFENGLATQINYQVFVNNQVIDQLFPIQYNYDLIQKEFDRLSNISDACLPTYPVSSAFTIVTPNKLCDSIIPRIENELTNFYKNLQNLPANANVIVKIPKAGIEELVDDNSNLYYSLPIYITADGQVLNPIDNNRTYTQLIEQFKKIPLKADPLSIETFQVINTALIKTYRVVQAFKFYFNMKISKKNANFISDFIKQSFEKANLNITNSQVSIKLQQDVIFYANQNSFSANRLISFISNSNNQIYDSRLENLEAINQNLKILINSVDFLVNENNEKLTLFDTNYLSQFQMIKYSDLFVLFLRNKYLSISSNDLVKISTWLNEQWRLILNNQQSSILILNNQLYFDDGNLVIGINYLIQNQDPQCIDLSLIENQLQSSFLNDLVPKLCPADYEYYQIGNYSNPPTRFFYTLDIIGQIQSSVKNYSDAIRLALSRSWAKEYSGRNVSLTGISKNYETRVGSLGTQFTRVSYLISIDGQQALNYFYSPPSNQAIEYELSQTGTDMRVYPDKTSLAKSALSSLYVQQYPLSPSYRANLEKTLSNSIQSLNIIKADPNVNRTVQILFYELYKGQLANQNVSRIYYAYYLNNQLVYPCELVDLYLSNITGVPTVKSFDYVIKSRYIDLLYENFVFNTTNLVDSIKSVWLAKNPSLNKSDIDIKLGEFSFYTSPLRNLILRINYFLTINGFNVNDATQSYTEPLITDFSSLISHVSPLFPNKAYKTFVKGNPSSININDFENSINSAWKLANLDQTVIPSNNVRTTTISNRTLFYDYNDNYNNLTRNIYKVLFDSYADQNDLFNMVPNESQLKTTLDVNQIKYCDRINCIPSLFYDFYTSNNFTLSQAKQLIDRVKNAWVKQNTNKDTDTAFKNSLISDAYSVIPYGPLANNQIINRVIYSMALAKNDLNLDSSDYLDPTDAQYNASLFNSIVNRGNYTEYIPTTSPLVADKVEGIKWWMILIIVLACLAFIIFLILCLYALFVRRRMLERSSTSSFTSLSNSLIQKQSTRGNQEISFDPAISLQNQQQQQQQQQQYQQQQQQQQQTYQSNQQVSELRQSFKVPSNLVNNQVLYDYSNDDTNIINTNNRVRSLSATNSYTNLANNSNLVHSNSGQLAHDQPIIINKYYQHHHYHHHHRRSSLNDLNDIDSQSMDLNHIQQYEVKIN